jgi:biopolymer transport protein TolR
MQSGGSSGGLQSEMNVTPLVDVVLVLLIIFMVVVPLAMQGYDMDIPRTSTDGPPAQEDVQQVILSIAPAACRILEPTQEKGLPADCRVFLAERELPVTDLPANVAEMLGSRPKEERVLFLAADDRLNYEGVMRIVDLAKSNVQDLTIDVIEADSGRVRQ